MSRSTFNILFYANKGKEKGGWKKHTECQHRKAHADGSDTNRFYMIFVHTSGKDTEIIRIHQTIRHISAVLSHFQCH